MIGKHMRTGLTGIAVLLSAFWVFAQQSPSPQNPSGGQPGRGGRGQGRGGESLPLGRGAHANRKVVLAWADTRNGQAQHAYLTHALAVLERLGYESGAYDLYIRTDSNIISFHPLKTDGTPASGGPNLNNIDAILFAGHRNVPLDDAGKADLITAIRDKGIGFVSLFIGLTPWDTFPEMANILGAGFVGHSPFTSGYGTLVKESPDFPGMQDIPNVMPQAQEYYQPKDFSRDKIQVLLRLDISKYSPVAGYKRTDGDYPVAWAKMYGKGRVFYSSLGNGSAEQWDDNALQLMYFEGIKWALGLTPYEIKPHPLPADVRSPQGAPGASTPARGGR